MHQHATRAAACRSSRPLPATRVTASRTGMAARPRPPPGRQSVYAWSHVTCAVSSMLYRCRCCSRRAGWLRPAVRERQPVRQLSRRLVGRLPVEGHHRSRHPRRAPQLCTPSVAHRRHVNLVRTSANRLFEAMHVHECLCPERKARVASAVDLTHSFGAIKRSGARSLVHNAQLVRAAPDRCTGKISSAGSPQDLHGSSTGFPQVPPHRVPGGASGCGR